MTAANVSLGLAFIAGLASFLSPCVFSLVPAYVGYLSGRAAGSGIQAGKSRGFTVLHGLAFVVGFSLVFISLGVTSSAVGALLYNAKPVLTKIGGVVVVIFGLHMIGIFRIPFLEYDTRRQTLPDPKWGLLSSVLMGVFFSAGWAPCVGPVLGAILTLSFSGGSIALGTSLLTAYSAGLAIPFLMAAYAIGWVTLAIRKYGKIMRYVEVIMGVILVGVGIMLFLGIYEQIARFFPAPWVNFGL